MEKSSLWVQWEPYPCWASLWPIWKGTVRTWKSPVCTFSCSSSLLPGAGKRSAVKTLLQCDQWPKKRTSKDGFYFDRVPARCPVSCAPLAASAVMTMSEQGALVLRLCERVYAYPSSSGKWLRGLTNTGTLACFVCQVINFFLAAVYLCRSGKRCEVSLYSSNIFNTPFLSLFLQLPKANSHLLLLSYYSAPSPSQIHKQMHTATLDLVVRLLLCSRLSTICGCFTLTDGCHGGVAWLAQEEVEEKRRDRMHTINEN